MMTSVEFEYPAAATYGEGLGRLEHIRIESWGASGNGLARRIVRLSLLALGLGKVDRAQNSSSVAYHVGWPSRDLIAAGHPIEWLMGQRPTPAPDPHPGLRERSCALQRACQGLQKHAKDLRRQSNLALEESRHLRADVKLLLSR
jgi:hypothetical protein